MDLDELLALVDETKARVSSKRPLSQLELKVIEEEFVVRYTYNSNAIEGNTLTLSETALVLKGLTIGSKPLKDHLEAVGHHDAFQYLTEVLKNGSVLTEQTVKDIHSYVLLNQPLERGNYRTVDVMITGSKIKLPYSEDVPSLMASLIEDINKSAFNPIEKAAIYHVDFERIHPFVDGNGRTGRLLMNLLLMQHGYLPIDIKYADRARYYETLTTFEDTHSYDGMIRIVAEYELDELKRRLRVFGERDT